MFGLLRKRQQAPELEPLFETWLIQHPRAKYNDFMCEILDRIGDKKLLSPEQAFAAIQNHFNYYSDYRGRLVYKKHTYEWHVKVAQEFMKRADYDKASLKWVIDKIHDRKSDFDGYGLLALCLACADTLSFAPHKDSRFLAVVTAWNSRNSYDIVMKAMERRPYFLAGLLDDLIWDRDSHVQKTCRRQVETDFSAVYLGVKRYGKMYPCDSTDDLYEYCFLSSVLDGGIIVLRDDVRSRGVANITSIMVLRAELTVYNLISPSWLLGGDSLLRSQDMLAILFEHQNFQRHMCTDLSDGRIREAVNTHFERNNACPEHYTFCRENMTEFFKLSG